MASQSFSSNPAAEKASIFAFDLSELISQDLIFRLLTWSLSLTFFWFGTLKVIGMSPVVNLLKHSFPLFATQPYLGLLGLFEMVLAAGLLIPRLRRFAAGIAILHLLGTISVACINPGILFAPYFPVLTMEGEFIVKNFILISAFLIILFRRPE